MKNLKFSLLENAIDSLNQGISFVLDNPDDKSKLKLSVLLIAQAVELILKERLSREHPSLIFNKVEQVNSSDAHTVSIEDAKKRLQGIAKIFFTDSDSDAIRNISEIRNKIQHYKIEISHSQALSYIHLALAFLISFIKSELGKDIKDLITKEQYASLLQIESLYEGLKRLAQDRIEELQTRLEPRKAKDLMYWNFSVIGCPECGEEFYVFSEDEDISECKLCGYSGGFVECSHCNSRFPSGSWDLHFESEHYVECESCWTNEQDD